MKKVGKLLGMPIFVLETPKPDVMVLTAQVGVQIWHRANGIPSVMRLLEPPGRAVCVHRLSPN